MKAAIRQRALELGFDDCRFTNANPPESANHFLDWIDSEKHGSMAWIKRNAEKRVDPKLVLENASSIITLAASYEGKDTIDDDSPNLGLIARYARYRDYHDSIGEALIQLTEYLQTLTSNEAKSLWYVDLDVERKEKEFSYNVGDAVLCRHNRGARFFGGKIEHIYHSDGVEKKFDVLYDDGDTEKEVERWLIKKKN